MRPSALMRLAFSGSLTDRVRAALTAFAAAVTGLAILALGTILNIAPTEDTRPIGDSGWQTIPHWRYTTELLNNMALRPGLIALVAAFMLPALALIAQSARLGGPARDHRLAAMRLAGATPRQSLAIAATEQGATVALGGILAMAAFPLLRNVLHRPAESGMLPLPTDTWPIWWSWVVVGIGLPVLAALVSALALRKLLLSPLAAAKRIRRTRPRLWPAGLIVAGLAGMAAARMKLDQMQAAPGPDDSTVPYTVMFLGVAGVCVGVPLCAAGIGYLGARLALRLSNRPSMLIATRRVLADPYMGSRAVTGLLVCTVLTAALVGIGTTMDFGVEVGESIGRSYLNQRLTSMMMTILNGLALGFVLFATFGLLIALVDGSLTRRRTEAALLASETPNLVLIRSRVTMVMLTAVPGVMLGLAAGYAAPTLAVPPAQKPASITLTCHAPDRTRAVVPCTPEGLALQAKSDSDIGAGEYAYSGIDYQATEPWRNIYPPVPWTRLALVGLLALAAVALATVLSLLAGGRSSAATALRTT